MYQAAAPSLIMKASDEQYLYERLLPVYNVLAELGVKNLPADFNQLPVINIYETDNGHPAYDWESKLGNKGEAWIITPLQYTKCGTIRTTSRCRSWNSRWGRQEKKPKDYSYFNLREDLKNFCWKEDLYNLKGKNKGQDSNCDEDGHCKYAMHEYTPNETRPEFALCKIYSLNKEAAHKRQPRKSYLRKDPETDDGYIKKFVEGETSQVKQQGVETEHTTEAHDKSGIPEIEAKLVELGQYYSKSEIQKIVLPILEGLISARTEYAMPHSSGNSKHITSAPTKNG